MLRLSFDAWAGTARELRNRQEWIQSIDAAVSLVRRQEMLGRCVDCWREISWERRRARKHFIHWAKLCGSRANIQSPSLASSQIKLTNHGLKSQYFAIWSMVVTKEQIVKEHIVHRHWKNLLAIWSKWCRFANSRKRWRQYCEFAMGKVRLSRCRRDFLAWKKLILLRKLDLKSSPAHVALKQLRNFFQGWLQTTRYRRHVAQERTRLLRKIMLRRAWRQWFVHNEFLRNDVDSLLRIFALQQRRKTRCLLDLVRDRSRRVNKLFMTKKTFFEKWKVLPSNKVELADILRIRLTLRKRFSLWRRFWLKAHQMSRIRADDTFVRGYSNVHVQRNFKIANIVYREIKMQKPGKVQARPSWNKTRDLPKTSTMPERKAMQVSGSMELDGWCMNSSSKIAVESPADINSENDPEEHLLALRKLLPVLFNCALISNEDSVRGDRIFQMLMLTGCCHEGCIRSPRDILVRLRHALGSEADWGFASMCLNKEAFGRFFVALRPKKKAAGVVEQDFCKALHTYGGMVHRRWESDLCTVISIFAGKFHHAALWRMFRAHSKERRSKERIKHRKNQNIFSTVEDRLMGWTTFVEWSKRYRIIECGLSSSLCAGMTRRGLERLFKSLLAARHTFASQARMAEICFTEFVFLVAEICVAAPSIADKSPNNRIEELWATMGLRKPPSATLK